MFNQLIYIYVSQFGLVVRHLASIGVSGTLITIVVRPQFRSASALLSLQKLWFVDTVL